MKPVPGYPDYFVTEKGDVFSVRPRGGDWSKGGVAPFIPRKLKCGKSCHQYRSVELRRGVERKRKLVAVVVCEAFHGPRPPGMVCCHGPNGPSDDSAANVSWGTMKKNMGEDRRRDGTMRTKLTAQQIREIRALAGKKFLREIGEQFGVSQVWVGKIIRRKYWGWLE